MGGMLWPAIQYETFLMWMGGQHLEWCHVKMYLSGFNHVEFIDVYRLRGGGRPARSSAFRALERSRRPGISE